MYTQRFQLTLWGEDMIIVSSNCKRLVEVGGSDILYSLYSTILVRLDQFVAEVPLAIGFLQNGICAGKDGLETAREFNLLRDRLAQIPPDQAVYNLENLSQQAPWAGKLSPVITSCANLYTTKDGQDLLFEIVSLLCYGYYSNTDIHME